MVKHLIARVEKWGIKNVPVYEGEKHELKDRAFYWFIVKIPQWKNGRPSRLPLMLRRAKRLARIEGYSILFSSNQDEKIFW